MSSAAKLRKYGRGTATIAAAALVMTSFGPAAFASWDDAPQTPNVDTLQTFGTIGIVDTAAGNLAGDQAADTYGTDRTTAATAATAAGVTIPANEPGGSVAASGIDANPTAGEQNDENQGATLVYAGKNEQRIADVRLVLPNRFASGDILDLRLLDRSATEHSDGLANRSADTLVGFSGTEGVSVEVSQAMDPRTRVHHDTDAVDGTTGGATSTPANPRTFGNTETTMLPWTADTASSANPQRATAPGSGPAFSAPAVSQTNTQQGKDNLRLSVNNASTGDPNAVWVVTIKGLKVDLGKNATPGELRLVPFLSNAVPAGNGYTASPWFYGNAKEDNAGTPANTADDTPREVGIYTVPAFVSPVTVTSERNEIVADGLAQSIGKITVAETQTFSLQNGTYTIDFSQSGSDVTIESPAADIEAALSNGGTAETITNVSVANDKQSLSFTLGGVDNSRLSTITLSGLMLRATQAGSIQFNITGGSVSGSSNSWLASPAGTSTLQYNNPTGASIHPASAFLHWNSGANTPGTGVETRTVTAPASFPVRTTVSNTASVPTVTTTAGNDPLPSGAYVVSGGGSTITGPGSITLSRVGTTTTYTGAVPGQGNVTDSYTINLGATPATNFTMTAPAVSGAAAGISPAPGAANGLPVGTYTYADVDASGGVTSLDTLIGNGITLTRTGTANEWTDGTNTHTFTGEAAANLVIAMGTVSAQTNALSVAGSPNLPAGTYAVNAANTRIEGPGVVLTRVNTSTNTWTVAAGATAAGLSGGETYTIPSTQASQSFILGSTNNVTGVLGGYVTVTSGAQHMVADTYTVDGAPGSLTISGGGWTTQAITNGVALTGPASTGSVVLTGLAVGQTFTITSTAIDSATIVDFGVNQKDILAPVDEYTQLGTASSETGRIGGNNRYETAAKIAERWAFGDKSNTHGKVRNAIIASGENFPDALSASYLSQRMGAPVLLTQRGSIPADTLEALRDRQVDKVFIVGGPAAISNQVQEQLANLNTYMWSGTRPGDSDPNYGGLTTTGAKMQVQRLSSANPQNDNRYTTNQLVNMYAAAWGGDRTIGKTVYRTGEAGKYTAIFARGDNFPDALAAGVLTAGINSASGVLPVNETNDQALPLVLTQPNELSASAVALINNLDVEHGLIVGGANAVSDSVKTAIEDQGVSNTRIAGDDRYFTAAAVDEFAMRSAVPGPNNEFPGLGFIGTPNAQGVYPEDTTSWLANGLRFPDALTAAPWLGRNHHVLNLTAGNNDLSGGTKDFLSKRAQDVIRVNALGLGQAVNSAILTEANRIAATR